MANIRFEANAPGRGKLFIDGHEVSRVVSVCPELFAKAELPTVTIILIADSFEFVTAPDKQ